MAFLVVLFTAATIATAWRFHLTIASSLELRFENLDLVESLRTAKDHTDALNRDLELRVRERTAMRWELEGVSGGTRLTLWTNIDRRYMSMGAAGWHICFDVLDRLLAGQPIGRIVGPEAMKFDGWQRLNAEYAQQFTEA